MYKASCIYSPWNVLLSHFCVRSPFAHCAFTVRSACVHRAFIDCSPFAHRSQFCVHRSAWVRVYRFTKRSSFAHRAFSYRSQNVHRSLIVLKAFCYFHSELQRDRIVLKPSVQNSDKIRRNVCRRMGENFLCILEIT